MNARDISVGDKLTRTEWQPGAHVTVTAVGLASVLATCTWNELESPWMIGGSDDGWLPYTATPAFPELFVNVYEHFLGGACESRADCDSASRVIRNLRRLGVLHMSPDGTTEMEAA